MKYIVALGILGILLPLLLPSPRELLVSLFGENNPLAILFIILISFFIYFIIEFILQQVETLFNRFKNKTRIKF